MDQQNVTLFLDRNVWNYLSLSHTYLFRGVIIN